MSQLRRTTMLRRAMKRGCVVMPGAFNAGTARLVERAGFPGVYISGAGLANATAGVPDIGLLSMSEVVKLAGYIADAVKVPTLADADTGFGGVANVSRTVRAFERAGVAGIHLEDQRFPKRCGHVAGKRLIATDDMAEKIAAAVAARSDPDFLIVARTDARADEGMAAAIHRAERYLRAGADAIFPEALQSAAELREFAKQIKAPLLANMTEFGKSPLLSVRQLAAMGYRIILFPQTAFRVSMKASEGVLAELQRRGTQRRWISRMQTRDELYDLLDYDPASENWPT